ncbi:hypothetical protein FOXYSP1_05218 [Fusarium oxysporum f. sp. phaseoli]|jgi:hypothetical protein
MGRQKSRNDKVMGTQDIGQVQELDEAFRQDNGAELSCVASTTNGTASRMQCAEQIQDGQTVQASLTGQTCAT